MYKRLSQLHVSASDVHF